MAALASAVSFMVTNAKPRDLPVMRSIISATSADFAVLFEKILKIVFGGLKGEISYV